MEGALTTVSDLVLRPIAPIELVALLALLGAAAVLLALARGLKGAWLRLLSLTALLLALANPALVREDRAPLADVVALVVDESASQDLEDRRAQTKQAAEAIERAVEALAREGGPRRPIELRKIAVRSLQEKATLQRQLSEAQSEVRQIHEEGTRRVAALRETITVQQERNQELERKLLECMEVLEIQLKHQKLKLQQINKV